MLTINQIVLVLVNLLIYLINSNSPNIDTNNPALESSNSAKTEVPTITPGEPNPGSLSPEANPSVTMTPAQVVSVVDGDTIKVSINNKTETIRIIGIDTPETVDPRSPVQCYGREASNKMKEFVSGKTVYLEADPTQGEQDKYKRLLRFVFLNDGTDVGLSMIKDGFAHEYTYNKPYKYQTAYVAAQREARDNHLGLWSYVCQITVAPTPAPKAFTAPIVPSKTIQKTSAPAQGNSCTGPDLDCSDFSSQAAAQAFFNGCGFTITNDPMKLDSVGLGDGVACESLP